MHRRYVDDVVHELHDSADDGLLAQMEPVLTLGLHHEQQHQEKAGGTSLAICRYGAALANELWLGRPANLVSSFR